jgi:hypothetical protein
VRRGSPRRTHSPPAVRLDVRFLTGPRTGARAVFRHSPVRAGRSRDSDIRIPDSPEPIASGRHAEFVFEDGRWAVVDLGSTNGTRVNGVKVARAALEDGDRITFGDQDVEVRTRTTSRRRPLLLAAGGLGLIAVVAMATWLLWRPASGSLDTLTAVARRSVYLVVIQEGERRTPVGTAFAVAGNRLVTNAHVAAPLAALPPGGLRDALVISTDPGERPRRVVAVTLHPAWEPGSIADDVALLAIDGDATTPLTLAGDDTIRTLEPGDTVAIFGFPAAFTMVDRPHGSMMVNALREVRGRYLVVDIGVTPGASGSPVFTPDGLVVGVIAGSGQLAGGEGASPGVAVSATVVREVMK